MYKMLNILFNQNNIIHEQIYLFEFIISSTIIIRIKIYIFNRLHCIYIFTPLVFGVFIRVSIFVRYK